MFLSEHKKLLVKLLNASNIASSTVRVYAVNDQHVYIFDLELYLTDNNEVFDISFKSWTAGTSA